MRFIPTLLLPLVGLMGTGQAFARGIEAAGPVTKTATPKNVVIVVVDDLGWTDLGCYGSTFHDTPRIDALAAQGIRFTEAYAAASVCSPTRAALMTGRHPVRVGITDWITGFEEKDPLLKTPEDRHQLALGEVTLAEALKAHGYTTGYFGKWHLGETAEFWPEHQGFDVNKGGFSKGSPPGGYYSPYKNPRLADGPEGEYLTDRLTEEAIHFIKENQSRPFLAYLAFYTVHTPIQGCDKWDAHYREKRETLGLADPGPTVPEGDARTRLHQSDPQYAAMVRSLDENIGRLLDELESLGLAEDTLVVFTSDNGGLSTQSGRIAPTSVRPLRAGKGWLYEGGIRIPLIVRAPGTTPPGSLSGQTAISMDLMPTVLDLLGLPARPELHRDGISLVPAMRKPALAVPRTLVWHYPHYHASSWKPGSAMRAGDWKLVVHYETGKRELFNLAEDPGETTDRANEYPETLENLTRRHTEWLEQMGAAVPTPIGVKMKKPNFIIIYADDLGFGDLGSYGASGIPTPNLDKMAAEGQRFTSSYATAATCTPSRYSLLTGSYPWRNPKARILDGDAPMIIGPDERTLPGTLREAGYATAVIGKWHIGLGDGSIDWNGEIRPTPLDVGFDQSYIMAATNDRVPCVYVDGRRVDKLAPEDPITVVYGSENPFPEIPTGKDHPELLRMRHSDEQHFDTIVNGVGRIGFSKGGTAAQWDDESMAEHFLDKAKAFISAHQEKPFFLYYALHQPHVPRIPGPRFAGATDKGPRGDVIVELDWCVGELLGHLKELGIDEDTVVVFSSDNGPILDDGYLDESPARTGDHKPAGPLRGGKYSQFDGGARVPMIVRAPGRIQPGVNPALFSHVDFLASFARLAGISLPPEELADSQDLAAVLLGESQSGRAYLVTEGFGAKTVIRAGHWVYLPPYPGIAHFANKGIETGNAPYPQLYNLHDDIGQRTNLAGEYPEKVEQLHALLDSIRKAR